MKDWRAMKSVEWRVVKNPTVIDSILSKTRR